MLQFVWSICCKVSNELRALGSISGYRTHLGQLRWYGLHKNSFGMIYSYQRKRKEGFFHLLQYSKFAIEFKNF